MDNRKYEDIAKKIRIDIIREIEKAGSGHPGGSLSAVDILTALYFEEMNIDPKNPDLENRDRFILSKGHAAPALYAVLGERGYFDVEETMTLRKLGSKFQGHPNMSKVPGVEMSTGSLGQGFSASVGMAISQKYLNKSESMIYCLLGDGELQEGIVWEAAMSAAHYKLDNMIAFVDWNGLQIDGENEKVMKVSPIDEKFASFGWNVIVIDGHNFDEIFSAIDIAKKCKGRPTAVIAKTHKGEGVSFMKDEAGWHGKAPNKEEAKLAIEELGGIYNDR